MKDFSFSVLIIGVDCAFLWSRRSSTTLSYSDPKKIQKRDLSCSHTHTHTHTQTHNHPHTEAVAVCVKWRLRGKEPSNINVPGRQPVSRQSNGLPTFFQALLTLFVPKYPYLVPPNLLESYLRSRPPFFLSQSGEKGSDVVVQQKFDWDFLSSAP